MAERINDDLLLKILQRLPVKSLARFCCVSPSWNSLICSSYFIARHLSYSTTTPLLLASRVHPQEGNGYLAMDYHDEDNITCIPDFKINSQMYEIAGTANGVICLWAEGSFFSDMDFYASFALWNPMIRKYIELPSSKVLLRDKFWFGFGIKASENDFRVLLASRDDPNRVLFPDEEDIHSDEDDPYFDGFDSHFEANYKVQICSTREQIWRDLPAEILSRCIVRDGASRCLFNGVLHVAAFNDHLKSLLLFDFEKEEFSFMALPKGVFADVVVTEYDGKLTTLDYAFLDEVPCWKVWSMMEYGDPTSWVCMFDVPLSTLPRTSIYYEKIVGITPDGEIIIDRNDGVFLLRDRESCARRWPDMNSDPRNTFIYACRFVASLVFMDRESKARCLPS